MLKMFFTLIKIFIFATFLNILVLYLIKLGIFGKKLQAQNWPKLLNDNIYLISIVTIVVVTITNYLLHSQVIFLDSNLILKTKLENTNIEVNWNSAERIFENLGASGVFIASIQIATSVLAKTNIHPLPKLAMIGATGGGFTVIYQSTLNRTSIQQLNKEPTLQVNIKDIENLDVSKDLGTPDNLTSFLSNIFDLKKTNSVNTQIQLDPHKPNRYFLEKSVDHATSASEGVIQKLDKANPNWKENTVIEKSLDTATNDSIIKYLDENNPSWREKLVASPQDTSVIQSPLEKNEHFQTVLNILDDHLLLNCIILYLLVMLIIIITVKLVLVNQKEIKFNFVRKLPLGNFIARLLAKYIEMWQTSSNVWIYFLFFSLICFTLFLIYSTNDLIRILKFLLS